MDCPSTPAAPRLAFTCLYASHTSRLAIQNGLALSMLVIPLRVVGWVKPDDGVPSVQRHYSTFVPTTDASAPVFRIGTLVLAATTAWISPFTSERQVPVFLIEARLKVTPPSYRTPVGQRHAPQPWL